MQTASPAKAAKSKTTEAHDEGEGTTLSKHPDEPIVTVEYGRRTYTDRRIAAMRENPHAMGLVDECVGVRFASHDGHTYLLGQTCPRCNQASDTLAGHPALRRKGGHYVARGGSTETVNVCVLCGYNEGAGAMFSRIYGDSEKHLDAAKIPKPVLADFVAVRFRKDKRALSRAFMTSIRSFEKLGQFDPATDFEAIAVRALTEADAQAAFLDIADSWWAPIEVDSQLRPVRRWNSLRWNGTDEGALNEALQIQRNQKIAEIDRELRAERVRRLAELGL